MFAVRTGGGAERAVIVEPGTLVLGRQAATLQEIRPGDALGVAAQRAADGSLTATSINIFSPELWQRVPKGQWPMESGQLMTNAVVTRSAADRVEGDTLYMTYNEIQAKIRVPAGAEIHRLVTLRSDELKPGMTVSVRGTTDPSGNVAAAVITIERPGRG